MNLVRYLQCGLEVCTVLHAVVLSHNDCTFFLLHFRLKVLMAILWNCGVSWEETRESQSGVFCVSMCIRESKSKIPVSVRMNVLMHIVSILLKTLAEAQCLVCALSLFCDPGS